MSVLSAGISTVPPTPPPPPKKKITVTIPASDKSCEADLDLVCSVCAVRSDIKVPRRGEREKKRKNSTHFSEFQTISCPFPVCRCLSPFPYYNSAGPLPLSLCLCLPPRPRPLLPCFCRFVIAYCYCRFCFHAVWFFFFFTTRTST